MPNDVDERTSNKAYSVLISKNYCFKGLLKNESNKVYKVFQS